MNDFVERVTAEFRPGVFDSPSYFAVVARFRSGTRQVLDTSEDEATAKTLTGEWTEHFLGRDAL